jgi:hypothetical protein
VPLCGTKLHGFRNQFTPFLFAMTGSAVICPFYRKRQKIVKFYEVIGQSRSYPKLAEMSFSQFSVVVL